MTLTSFTKIFARKTTLRSSGLGINPAREWIIGLVVAFLLLSFGAAYATFSFWGHLNEGEQVPLSESGVVEYREELVREVLVHYQDRAAEFDLLRGETHFDGTTQRTQGEESSASDDGTLGAE